MSVRPKKNRRGEIVPGEYIIDYLPNGKKGKRERITFVGTEPEARALEMEMRGQTKPTVREILSPTCLDALPEFLRDYGNRVAKSTVVDFHWAWKQLEQSFAIIPLRNVNPRLVEIYKAKRLADGVKKRTINRELSYLSALLRWAEDQKIIDEFPRIKRFPKKQTTSPLAIVHAPDEIAAIIDEVNPAKRAIALLLYDAGLRRSEACNLKGSQIDLATRLMRIIGKGNKERIVPILTDRLHEALKEAKDSAGNGYLFINPATQKPYVDPRRALKAASDRAGVDKRIYSHLLRHDHATHSAMAEVSPLAIQQILGHSDQSTTAIYQHLAAGFLTSQGSKFATLANSSSAKNQEKKRPTKKKDPT
jgi:site-specific recombinase XerD